MIRLILLITAWTTAKARYANLAAKRYFEYNKIMS